MSSTVTSSLCTPVTKAIPRGGGGVLEAGGEGLIREHGGDLGATRSGAKDEVDDDWI